MQLELWDEDDRELQLDAWWSPRGRMSIKRHCAGAELRHYVMLAGRDVEDVPLPDLLILSVHDGERIDPHTLRH